MTSAELLARLVSFPTVCRTPNTDIIDFISSYLAGYGVKAARIMGPEGDRENLFATIGPNDVRGYILSGHLDVVPANEAGWTSDPFVLRVDRERLIGRGTVDMKGFVAAVLASVPHFVRCGLKAPLHIALSYDEEIGCVGVRHLIATLPELCPSPIGCVVGEPSGMRPVLQHKGKIAVRILVRGRPGHSSRPDLAENAIHGAADLIVATKVLAARLKSSGRRVGAFMPPYSTVQVGVVSGGSAVNVVPELCVLDVEARAIPGENPRDVIAPILSAASELESTGTIGALHVVVETLSEYPGLSLASDHGLAKVVAELAGREILQAVSYGTEAGLYQAAGIPSIICGPGNVDRAHKPDEYILSSELDNSSEMLCRLAYSLSN